MIKLAWLNLHRNPSRALLTIFSVFIAAFFSIIFGSTKNGILNSSTDSILKLSGGHIEIRSKSYSKTRSIDDIMHLNSTTLDSISMFPYVKSVLPILQSYLLISHSSSTSTKAVAIIGIDPEAEKDRILTVSGMVEGEWFSKCDKGVIIGENMRDQLGLGVGDTLAVMGMGYHGSSAVGLIPIQGIARIPVSTVDKSTIFITLSAAQELFQADDCYSEIYIMSERLDKVDLIKSQIQEKFSSEEYEIRDWKSIIEEYLFYFRFADAIGFIIMLFLYILVGSNILGTIIMMTKERKLEFSVLISIGMSRNKLSKSLFYELIIVALLGVILAAIITLPIVHYFTIHPIPLYGDAVATLKQFSIYSGLYMSLDFTLFIKQFLIVLGICLVFATYPIAFIQHLKVDEGLSKRDANEDNL
jgi:putative ABC transport system permease protein